MTKKFKHIISLTLVFVFLMPMTIKIVDGLFHHHDYFYCSVKNVKYVHTYHKKCPIPSLDFSFFLVGNYTQIAPKHFYRAAQDDNYHFVCYCNNLKYSFLLRAPPIFTGKIMTS